MVKKEMDQLAKVRRGLISPKEISDTEVSLTPRGDRTFPMPPLGGPREPQKDSSGLQVTATHDM